jgi:tRNA-splicing ligase RtcB (3'-phosphate/5'-hydroxy nucleic acid ligase)
MQKIIKTDGVPVRLWLDEIEEGALRQAVNVAMLPFAFSHIALMPDAHVGYGMPVGGVLAAEDFVVPNAVGVDIGCGMCAVKTNLSEISKSKLIKITEQIKSRIPVGFKHHKQEQNKELMPQGFNTEQSVIVKQEYGAALFQLGTLGGGNHFIEIQQDTDNQIWLMIHSGSRNIGLKVADYYHRLARKLLEKEKIKSDFVKDLAWLPANSSEGQSYLMEMDFCVEFAYANRNLMMHYVQEILSDAVKGNICFEPMINIAHNYVREEHHYERKVFVHRKGATSAKKGESGIIPGSQGSKSYIVKGLGNPLSYMSCSHGAGRKMGRKEAQRTLNLHDEISILNNQGIIHCIRTGKDLEEATGAYKNIENVMDLQKDLVEAVVELRPLAVVKG